MILQLWGVLSLQRDYGLRLISHVIHSEYLQHPQHTAYVPLCYDTRFLEAHFI